MPLGECTGSSRFLNKRYHYSYTHMQNSEVRDQFIRIHIENVKPKMEHNFKRVTSLDYFNFDTPYDYYSIMHYSRNAFSANGEDTMVPVDPKYLDVIGNAEKLSDGDITR
jgi:Astacin (Peptidase family M12A)